MEKKTNVRYVCVCWHLCRYVHISLSISLSLIRHLVRCLAGVDANGCTAVVNDEELRALLQEWSSELVAHMDLEESLIIPLVATMSTEAREELGKALKKGMRQVHDSKRIQEISQIYQHGTE